MTEDYKKIAESIRSGTYFGEARGWFEAMYIGPISERSFFLIIAVMAAFVALFGFIAISNLLPITTHEPILIRAGSRPDEVQQKLVQLAPGHIEVNPAILKFYITRYVQAREGYESHSFTSNALFVQAQSSPAAYNAYAQAYNPASTASPFNGLGENGLRIVTVKDVRVKRHRDGAPEGTQSATVTFTTDLTATGTGELTTTKWTADIDYIYTGLTSEMVVDPETKKKELKVTDPHFQVVNYALSQTQTQ